VSWLAGDRWFDTWGTCGVEGLPELSHTTAIRQAIIYFHHSFTETEREERLYYKTWKHNFVDKT